MLAGQGIELVELPRRRRAHGPRRARRPRQPRTSRRCAIQQPTFLGALEAVDELTDWAHARDMLVIGVCNPTMLALLKPPGAWGDRGRRHRLRRGPAARHPALLRRSVFRLHGLPRGAGAPDAGAHRRPHGGRRRPPGLHADAAGPRAAHPPLQGDVEHLHQPGPDGDRGDDLHVAHGRRGPAPGRCPVPRQYARAGRAR